MAGESRPGACLVIGAGDGLGSAIARAFADQGLTVCVTRRARHLDQLEALAIAEPSPSPTPTTRQTPCASGIVFSVRFPN